MFTKHAIDQMTLRAIPQSDAEAVLKSG